MTDEVTPAAPADPGTPPVVATPPAGGPPAAAAPPAAPPAGDPPAAPAAPASVATVWGDDWRQKLAGEDKGYLKQLERFADPAAYAKSHRELQAKLSSGEYKKAAPGKDATAEEIATWRKENGVPESVDGYKIEPPKGVVFGDADKPLLDSFTQHAHASGWNNAQLNQALAWYGQHQEKLQAEQATKDDDFQIQATEQLREMWPGQEYHRNRNAAKSLIDQMPKDFRDLFAAGRTADGRIIGDHPVVLAAFAQLSRELNPAATVVPAGTSDVGKSIGDEIANLEKMMGDRSSDYWRGPKAAGMQTRYRELVDARDKIKSRAA